jgi:flagellin
MASINTNIGALNAQRSMSDQIAKSDQAIEKLSTGLRINHAADDAAGSAIASKMEAQVRSLGVAIRNGHDAISMTQTAEGALGEMENILQRVRELAVQAGNSTLSASDRTAIQEEVTALTSEMNDIASTTNFNGVKLLDGSNKSLDFQVGVNASDGFNVKLESSSAVDLGLTGSMGAKTFTSGRVTLGTYNAADVDAIKINGENFLSAAVGDASTATTAAAIIATGINANTSTHGAVATAFNKIEGSEMGDSFEMTATFTVSGVTIAIQSTMQAVVDEINESVAGVTATLGNNNSLTISNTDGGQIIIAGNAPAGVGLTAGTYEGFYSLENVDGSDVKIELGNLANGYVQEATALPSYLALFGLNETDGGGHTKSTAVDTNILALTDDIRINDVQVGATLVDSAQAKADAINAVSAESGVTATASTTMFLDLDFDQDANDVSFEVNGTAIAVNALNSVSDVAAAINTADVGVVATATTEGLLKLFDSAGSNITIDMSTLTTYVAAGSDADNLAITVGAAMVARGNIELTAIDGGVIKLTDSSATNAGLAKLGLEGQSAMEASGTGGVNVSTLSGATSSLSNIDAAIEKLSGFRASFGAVENRIDAKINNLTTLKVNTQAAQSRIEDADFAAETTNMTKAQILSQAATSMLAQANSSKQNLLALLQG